MYIIEDKDKEYFDKFTIEFLIAYLIKRIKNRNSQEINPRKNSIILRYLQDSYLWETSKINLTE